ncbi:butyrophilin subfamily 3 member A2 isoform X8 [Oncorhynchus kisutch]|uniref:butyrophilin subfamily 3 member A2 isoform X8 n=1 Tax=Oncorhynchus kisutch TaxID=8019 RepID=UPI0012DFC96D|nr:butyrophilin subfamily 3 member A2-like isoform X8 [Oncorhynchus kisutch]
MFTTVGNRGTMHLGLCLRVLILSALTVPIRAAQPAPETFTLTVPDGPTSTLSGSSVSLLCQVSPLFNAEPLEVRWYHSSNSHSPALLYKDHKIQEAPVDPRYRGRVSLTGGMERGNVSLTLERVTLEDRGEYVCQVTSEQWYEKASVFLTVNVTGREPVLSVAEARGGGGQVNVTCSSEGWSPQPKLTWRNKEGTEIRYEQVLNTSDPHGLVSVSSWLLYASSYSDWLACTVYLSEEAKREGRILPHTAVPGVYKEAFIVTLILSLVIICALCSVILCKRRGSMWSSSQKSRNRSDQAELGQRAAETEHLIEGAENAAQTPTEQRAAGNDVYLEGAENTVLTPTEQRAAGKEVNLKDWHQVKGFKGVWLCLIQAALTVLMAAQSPVVFTLWIPHGPDLTRWNSSISILSLMLSYWRCTGTGPVTSTDLPCCLKITRSRTVRWTPGTGTGCV